MRIILEDVTIAVRKAVRLGEDEQAPASVRAALASFVAAFAENLDLDDEETARLFYECDLRPEQAY